MAAVKRVQKLLVHAEKRDTQSAAAQVHNAKRRKTSGRGGAPDDLTQVAAVLAEKKLKSDVSGENKDEVVVKATGKAIEKALGLGLWFQQREGYNIQIKTGSVGAIDDIIAPDDIEAEKPVNGPVTEEIPEARVRHASVIEILVSLR